MFANLRFRCHFYIWIRCAFLVTVICLSRSLSNTSVSPESFFIAVMNNSDPADRNMASTRAIRKVIPQRPMLPGAHATRRYVYAYLCAWRTCSNATKRASEKASSTHKKPTSRQACGRSREYAQKTHADVCTGDAALSFHEHVLDCFASFCFVRALNVFFYVLVLVFLLAILVIVFVFGLIWFPAWGSAHSPRIEQYPEGK